MKASVILRAPFTFARAVWHAGVFLAEGRPVLTPQSIRKHRLSICETCCHNENSFCGLCACYTEAKTFVSSESCPDTPPRWAALTFVENQDTSP
jgi:hypothetical protein